MFNKYDLEIVSAESGKKYKKHDIDGLRTIGVYENEPFKIRFRNNTGKKVQVRVSVDGTDVLTGEEAHTRIDGRMWVVQAYETLELKAWPEDNDGGAEFLFGRTANSVAANTHGNLQGKGLIAVAVFEDKPIARTWFNNDVRVMDDSFSFNDTLIGAHNRYKSSDVRSKGLTRSYSSLSAEPVPAAAAADLDSLEEGPAVGAGDYQQQKITKAAGLFNPVFAETVTVKYEWWTSLRSKLRQNQPPVKTAFPGDQKNIDLGRTPRLETRSGRLRRTRRKSADVTRLRPEEKYVEHQRFG